MKKLKHILALVAMLSTGPLFAQMTREAAENYFESRRKLYIEEAERTIKPKDMDLYIANLKIKLVASMCGEEPEQTNEDGALEAYTQSNKKSTPAMARFGADPADTVVIDETSFTSNCENVNFEDGNYKHWTKYMGTNPGTFHAVPSGTNERRITFVSAAYQDTTHYGSKQYNYSVVAPDGGQYSVRLGNNFNGAEAERMSYRFKVKAGSPFFQYRYAVHLEDPDHDEIDQPYFEVKLINDSGKVIDCSTTRYVSGKGLPGFKSYPGGVVKNWSTNFIDLSKYVNQVVTVVFEVGDCRLGGHFGYAYIDGSCFDGFLSIPDIACAGDTIAIDPDIFNNTNSFAADVKLSFPGANILSPKPNMVIAYPTPGLYKYTVNIANLDCPVNFSRDVVIEDCNESKGCCQASFSPTPGERYYLSGWAREMVGDTSVSGYTAPAITVKFLDGATGQAGPFSPSGAVIDGWQRIEGVVDIPKESTLMFLQLENLGENEVLFDDIRFVPFNSTMKSFVYDQSTKRLVAQHDDNNYSTFYEYDEEGKLIRIKKETERGIKTIQESRSNMIK